MKDISGRSVTPQGDTMLVYPRVLRPLSPNSQAPLFASIFNSASTGKATVRGETKSASPAKRAEGVRPHDFQHSEVRTVSWQQGGAVALDEDEPAAEAWFGSLNISFRTGVGFLIYFFR